MRRWLAAVLCALCASVANAATFIVVNLNDSGAGSLRDAAAHGNASVDADVTITFQVTGVILLTSGPIRITRAMTIQGPSKFDLTIDGGGQSRVFEVTDPGATPCAGTPPGADFIVIIRGVTITNGRATDGRPGGGILADHSLRLEDAIVRKNAANQGGGIAFFPRFANQSLAIDRSKIEDNDATTTGGNAGFAYSGGGIWIGHLCALNVAPGVVVLPLFTVALTYSEVCGNSVLAGPLWLLGGGIAIFGYGEVQIFDTKITGNSVQQPATPGSGVYFGGNLFAIGAKLLVLQRAEVSHGSALKGGGVDAESFVSLGASGVPLTEMIIISSTISKNEAIGSGANGGAFALFGRVDASFYNSTIARNEAPDDAVSGIYLNKSGGMPAPVVEFDSTIAYNKATTWDVGANYSVIPTYPLPANNSLFGRVPVYAMLSGAANIIGQDPKLAWLAYNGGFTRTHALLAGSPALDAGRNTLTRQYDGRGSPFPRVLGVKPDIGAYEGVANRNVQGLYWAAPPGSHDGEGFMVNQQGADGEGLFVAGYLYDPLDRPLWLVFALSRGADGKYSGDAYTGTGSPFSAFDPEQTVPLKAGTVLLSIGDSGDIHAKFDLDFPVAAPASDHGAQRKAALTVSKTLTLTRELVGYPPPACRPATTAEQEAAINFQDIWWAYPAESESGWGIPIAHHGDTLFVAWFTYGADGRPLWMVFSATKTATGVYSGSVYTATGPSFAAANFDPSKVTGQAVGVATLTFASGNRGRFDYTINGIAQSKQITRQVFAAVGQVCQ